MKFGSPFRWSLALVLMSLACGAAFGADSPVLRPNPENPGTFLYEGRPKLLVGDYPAIASFVDADVIGPGPFAWKRFLDTTGGEGTNLVRQVFSMGEQPANDPRVLVPWARTGPGTAADGRPKYDLDRFDPRLFRRFRDAAHYARRKGTVLQVVLLDCWDIKENTLEDRWGWRFHAFNGANNVQGFDASSGDTGRQGFTDPKNKRLLAYQKALIHKVADTLKDAPNVLYEVANENYYNDAWELSLADDLKAYESEKGYLRHLVMPRDLPHHDYDNDALHTFDPAKLHDGLLGHRDKGQPLISDSDGGGMPPRDVVRRWGWTAFLSGGSVSYLDESWNLWFGNTDPTGRARHDTRADLGRLRRYAERFPFWRMTPLEGRVAGGDALALAEGDRLLLLYCPTGREVTLKGLPLGARYRATWYNPRTGASPPAETLTAADPLRLTKPDAADWAVSLGRVP